MVNAFQEFQVDMHMEGELTLSFKLLLFSSNGLAISLHLDSLGKQFLWSTRTLNFLQTSVRFLDQSITERTQTKLHHHTVIQNLSGDIGLMNGLLQMRHEQHIASNMEPLVKGMVVNVAQHGSSAEDRNILLVQEGTKLVSEFGRIFSSNNAGGDVGREQFLGGNFNLRNDLLRLEVNMFQSSHDDTTYTCVQVVTLKVNLGSYQDGIKSSFITHAVNVISCVRINALQRLRELIIQTLDKADQGATNGHRFASLRNDILIFIVEIISILMNIELLVCFEDLQKLRLASNLEEINVSRTLIF
jgi:hypothetical protein